MRCGAPVEHGERLTVDAETPPTGTSIRSKCQSPPGSPELRSVQCKALSVSPEPAGQAQDRGFYEIGFFHVFLYIPNA